MERSSAYSRKDRSQEASGTGFAPRTSDRLVFPQWLCRGGTRRAPTIQGEGRHLGGRTQIQLLLQQNETQSHAEGYNPGAGNPRKEARPTSTQENTSGRVPGPGGLPRNVLAGASALRAQPRPQENTRNASVSTNTTCSCISSAGCTSHVALTTQKPSLSQRFS